MLFSKKNARAKETYDAYDVDLDDEDEITEEEPEDKKKIHEDRVQNIVPIKRIYKGMIITSDDRYIRIVEIAPINFTLRSTEEQNNIIHLFSNWLKIAPAKLQFKVITRRADTNKIINNIVETSHDETNPKVRELINDHINFIDTLAGNEALTRRYFLAYEYEPQTSRQKSIDEIADEMEGTYRKIKTGLGTCGNEVLDPDDYDYFLAEVLYTFYNRASCVQEPFFERVVRVTSDVMRMNGLREGVDDYPDIPVADYIAPRGMDLTHSDFFICDGLYSAILMVKKDGYPTAVHAGWVSTLIQTGEGIDVDVILRKENRSMTKERVALKLKLNRIKENSRSDIDTDYEEIQGAIESASYIKSCLAGGEDFYRMYTFITVTAASHEELMLQLEAVNDYLYSNDIEVKQIKWRLEEALQLVTPLLFYKKELMSFASRNVMTRGAASTYMMTSAEICDDYGIVMGVNRVYSSLVNMDIFNTKRYKNANIAIIGTSGAGKTYTESVMALRMRMHGIQTFIIAPDKAHEFRRACVQIAGSFIKIGPGSPNCINIMEIRPVQNPIAEYLDEGDVSENGSWLSQKAEQLATFFHILINDISNEEQQLVDEAIVKTYNRYGITNDNNSIYSSSGEVKEMPIIGDLHATLLEREETKRVANILARFVTGSAQSFNHRTNVDLNNKFIVFDLSDLNGTMKAIGMYVVMDFLWSRIKEDRTERKALYIDEAWQLIGASTDTRAADFVYRIFKIIRGYGGSACLATQDISDLFSFQDGKFGKAIVSNSKTKIILQLEKQEAAVVQEALNLTKEEVRDICNFDRGEALICANNNKVPVFIRASRMEHELITTDPAQLRAIVEEKKRQAESAVLAQSKQNIPQTEVPKFDELESDSAQGNSDLDADTEPFEPAEEPVEEVETHCSFDPLPNPEKVVDKQKVKDLDAVMSMQAMDQLSDNEVVRNPDGTIDTFQPDVVLEKTEPFAEPLEELAAQEVKGSGKNKEGSPLHVLENQRKVDKDLEDSEDLSDENEAPEFSIMEPNSDDHFDLHPPDFF